MQLFEVLTTATKDAQEIAVNCLQSVDNLCTLLAFSTTPVLFNTILSTMCMTVLCCAFSVIIHIVSKCHEEGLEHYLRSFVKVILATKCFFVAIISFGMPVGWLTCAFFLSLVCIRDQQRCVRKVTDHSWSAGHCNDGYLKTHCWFQH